MSGETWLPVIGFEGSYSVSSEGRVRSEDRVLHDAWGRNRRWKGRILRPGIDSGGYPNVLLRLAGDSQRVRVHVLVARAFLGERPPGFEVAHGDGNPSSNALVNLRYATPSENQMDRVGHGTANRGVRHHCAVLTEELVREIRRRRALGERQKDIGASMGVGRTTIAAVCQRRSWGWVA